MNTDHVDIEKLRYFVWHIICKRPRREKSPGNSCYAMLYVGKGGGKKFAATKSLLPDQKSLTTKILWAHLVNHSWVNFNYPLCEKCPNMEFFLVRIFPHSNWIRTDAEYSNLKS